MYNINTLYIGLFLFFGHCLLIWIVIDRKKARFLNYYGHCLYIIQNYQNRKKNIYKSTKKQFQEEYYQPLIQKNQEEALKKSNNLFKDILKYILLYFQFILLIWWLYLIYILIANILLFIDDTLKD